MASVPSTNFARINKIILEPCRDIVFKIVCEYISPEDLPKKIKAYHDYKQNKYRLHPEQLDKICKKVGGKASEEDFDICGLYFILRNICTEYSGVDVPTPSQGWGKDPELNDREVPDDVERLRLKRNSQFAHATSAETSEEDFKKEISEIEEIVERLDAYLGSGYSEVVASLKVVCMDAKTAQEYLTKLKQLQKYDEETKQMVRDLTDRVTALETDGRSDGKQTSSQINLGGQGGANYFNSKVTMKRGLVIYEDSSSAEQQKPQITLPDLSSLKIRENVSVNLGGSGSENYFNSEVEREDTVEVGKSQPSTGYDEVDHSAGAGAPPSNQPSV